MTKMVLTLWTFLALVSATAGQLRCYENTVITCGEHDAIYNNVCDAYDNSATDPRQVTCSSSSECGTVTVTQSHQGNFEITVVLTTCMAATDGCLDKEQLEESSPELTREITQLEAAGVTTEKMEACTCGTNLCNSAINLAGRSVYLLPIIIATLKVILLGW